MLRIVLDTNVLVACISRKSPHFWIWESLLESKFELCVTTDILDEYAEIVERYFGTVTAEYAMKQLALLNNIIPIVNYYRWGIMYTDPDDNKFFDCAVAANAHYLISEDNHFSILNKIDFPKVQRIRKSDFKNLLNI